MMHSIRANCWLLLIVALAGCRHATSENPSNAASSIQTSSNGAESNESKPIDRQRVAKPHVYNRVVALIIAIDRYQFPGVGDLHMAEREAKELADTYRDVYGFEVDPLLGSAATKAAIKNRLERYEKELGSNDALLVHFSGHGIAIEQPIVELPDYGTKGYLIPYDAEVTLSDKTDHELWAKEALEMRPLAQRLAKFSAQHVVFIADACCSGFITHRGNNIRLRRDTKNLLARPSCTVIAATTSETKAADGLFTPKYTRRLRQAKVVSVAELFPLVRTDVMSNDSARKQDEVMTPQMAQLRANGGDFVFIPVSTEMPEVDEGLVQVAIRFQARTSNLTELPEVLKAFDELDYRYGSTPAEKHSEWKARLERFEQKAALGHPVDTLALAGVYYCHTKGLGTEGKDNAKAFRAALKAYETGDDVGKFLVGDALYRGIHVEQNRTAGEKLLLESAEGGFALAQFTVGDYGIRQAANAKQATEAIGWLEKAIKANVNAARVVMSSVHSGDFLLHETEFNPKAFFEQDLQKAVGVIRPAISAKHPGAQYAFYLFGQIHGAKASGATTQEIVANLRAAANAGHAGAQIDMFKAHYLHWDKLGLTKDSPDAINWLRLAERQGQAEAHYMLSILYENGDYVAPSNSKSVEHCLRAYKHGHYLATRRLAMLYRDGALGLTQDFDRGLTLMRESERIKNYRSKKAGKAFPQPHFVDEFRD